MEVRHKDLVRNHYDAHAGTTTSTREALKQRRAGASLPLKKFHNEIKRQLIRRFARRGCTLLDLCCGRGGDLLKWRDAEINYAHGVDLSPGEIDDARRRFEELKEDEGRRKRALTLKAEFSVCDTLGDLEYVAPQAPYDAVTCMFALHYFFEGEHKLRMFMRNVSLNLKVGGYFFGTIPDGKRVIWHLNNSGGGKFDSPFLRLEKKWQDDDHKHQPFGHKYLWSLHDTVTAGAGESQGSLEFLSFINPIVRMAAHYQMEVVYDYEDEELYRMFEPEDAHMPFKHFCPHFPDSEGSLEVASSVFMAFVFRRVPDDAVVHVDPPLVKHLPPRDQWTAAPGGKQQDHETQEQLHVHSHDDADEHGQMDHDQGDGNEQEQHGGGDDDQGHVQGVHDDQGHVQEVHDDQGEEEGGTDGGAGGSVDGVGTVVATRQESYVEDELPDEEDEDDDGDDEDEAGEEEE